MTHLYFAEVTRGRNSIGEVEIYKASSRAAGAAGFGIYASSHAEGVAAASVERAVSG